MALRQLLIFAGKLRVFYAKIHKSYPKLCERFYNGFTLLFVGKDFVVIDIRCIPITDFNF